MCWWYMKWEELRGGACSGASAEHQGSALRMTLRLRSPHRPEGADPAFDPSERATIMILVLEQHLKMAIMMTIPPCKVSVD